MRSTKIMASSFVLLAVGEVIPSGDTWLGYFKQAMEMTALGALILIVVYIFRYEFPSQRKEREGMRKEFCETLTKNTDKQERWEIIRHDDHESLQGVLRETVANCTASRMAMQEICYSDAALAHVDADRAHVDAGQKHGDAERVHRGTLSPPIGVVPK